MTKRYAVMWVHAGDPIGKPNLVKRQLSRHVSLGEAREAVKIWRKNDRVVWDVWIEDTENNGKKVR